MNVVLIQIDSLCRHLLSTYGGVGTLTPNLDWFAERALIFDQHYAGSLPCMPARREIWAGTEEFWWRPWGPLEPWDVSLATCLTRKGITTQLVTDHYHFFEWGSHSFWYDYGGWEFIRGHEYDNWRTEPVAMTPDWAQTLEARRGGAVSQYLQNVADFKDERDFFGPTVMRAASSWLDRNHGRRPFFLHVDCFDVHEPFHLPEPYRSLYTDADFTQFSPWPVYGRIDGGRGELDPEEVAWLRAQFAGKITMVDHWLGRVFDAIERSGLWDSTAVIVTTDHGFYLGEHGWIGKPPAPLYRALSHLPLFVWHPEAPGWGRRTNAITQTVDLYASILEMSGAVTEVSDARHSRSFLDVLARPSEKHRELAITGYNNERVRVSDGSWTLLREHDPQAAPPYIYTQQLEQVNGSGIHTRLRWRRRDYGDIQAGRFIPGVEMPVWRFVKETGRGWEERFPGNEADLLFAADDTDEEVNRAVDAPDTVAELERKLRQHARSLGVPGEQLARLRLMR